MSVLHVIVAIVRQVACRIRETASGDVVLMPHVTTMMMLAMVLTQLVVVTVMILMLLMHLHSIPLMVLAIDHAMLILVPIVPIHCGVLMA